MAHNNILDAHSTLEGEVKKLQEKVTNLQDLKGFEGIV